MINVTRSFLPDKNVFLQYIDGIWDRVHLTNHGPLVTELEEKLKNLLGVKHFYFLNNGTIALQIAIKALHLKGEIITTPFSYVATTSSIVWEGCSPVFVDINEKDFTIDVNKIEAAITPSTSAILATHVFGLPCNVKEIEKIATKHGLKVIYDAAHAFGVEAHGKGILNYGDISITSFHATKLFHTIEGGGIATNDDDVAHTISYMRNFGHKGQEDFWGIGINGKNSEFNAAMGLSIFPSIQHIIEDREVKSKLYDELLQSEQISVYRPSIPAETKYNYSYYPVVFKDEKQLLAVKDMLNASYIYPRRYFYPCLSTLPYIKDAHMPISEDISKRILCLPLFYDIQAADIKKIVKIIGSILKH
jgi:dTDP-4-amino-4,6-dideoxygalactose transaminase